MHFDYEPTDIDDFKSANNAPQQPANEPEHDDNKSDSIFSRDSATDPTTDMSIAHGEVRTEPKPRIPRAGTAFLTFATFFVAQIVVLSLIHI